MIRIPLRFNQVKCTMRIFKHLIMFINCFCQVVKKSLVTFVNKHLNKINLEVTDLDSQFSDGVYLCLLSGLLEGYFVPLYDFHLTPQVKHF